MVSVDVVSVVVVEACCERGIVADSAIQRDVVVVVVDVDSDEGNTGTTVLDSTALDTAKNDLDMIANILVLLQSLLAPV